MGIAPRRAARTTEVVRITLAMSGSSEPHADVPLCSVQPR